MEEAKSARRTREKLWVESLIPFLSSAIKGEKNIDVGVGIELPYRNEIHEYRTGGTESSVARTACYQTDILFSEISDDGTTWIPRLVIECKIGGVTTHDAITYIGKAAAHKHVHPYLRYGILIAEFDYIPARVVQHGGQFDFIATWRGEAPTKRERDLLAGVALSELNASRTIQSLLQKGGTRRNFTLIHRQLVVTEV